MNANSTVKCEACAGSCNGSPIPGVLWNGERCDMCERYQSDALAAAALASCVGEMAEAMLSILALYKEDPDDLETMDKGIKLMEPVLRKAGLLS